MSNLILVGLGWTRNTSWI